MFPQFFFFPQKLGEIILKAENLWQDIPFKFFKLQFCKKFTTKETSACASFKFQCMLEWGLSIYELESQLVRESLGNRMLKGYALCGCKVVHLFHPYHHGIGKGWTFQSSLTKWYASDCFCHRLPNKCQLEKFKPYLIGQQLLSSCCQLTKYYSETWSWHLYTEDWRLLFPQHMETKKGQKRVLMEFVSFAWCNRFWCLIHVLF
jgi:hypothetical protein